MKKFTQHFAENKKNIIAGLELMSDTYLPKIYECEEMFCRWTYDVEFRLTNSYKVEKEFYSSDNIEYFEDWTDDFPSFIDFIIRLKQGKVVKLYGEETHHTFCLDKQKLLEAIQSKRQEDTELYDPDELDKLHQEDIEKLSKLP